MDTTYPKLTPSGKRLLLIVGVIAIVIPVLVTYVLLSPPNLPTTISTVQTGSSASSSSNTAPNTIILPAGVGASSALNFQPSSITVASGTTITWVNDDTTSIHNVYFLTMPAGATVSTNPSPNSNTWTNNAFSVTLTVAGTYSYECQYHNGWMQGTITVTG